MLGLAPIIGRPTVLEFLVQIIQSLLRGFRRGLVDINLGLLGRTLAVSSALAMDFHLPHLLDLQQIQFILRKLLLLFGLVPRPGGPL